MQKNAQAKRKSSEKPKKRPSETEKLKSHTLNSPSKVFWLLFYKTAKTPKRNGKVPKTQKTPRRNGDIKVAHAQFALKSFLVTFFPKPQKCPSEAETISTTNVQLAHKSFSVTFLPPPKRPSEAEKLYISHAQLALKSFLVTFLPWIVKSSATKY